jgi:hypothetical protein
MAVSFTSRPVAIVTGAAGGIGAAESVLAKAEGLVVNVSSVAGDDRLRRQHPVCGEKGRTLVHDQVSGCGARPGRPGQRGRSGCIETDRTRDRTDVRDHVIKHAPAARLGAPADAIGGLVGSRYATGAVRPVDGGLGVA